MAAQSPVHTSNNAEATFDFVERIVRPVAFDNVASTLLLVWTGLNSLQHWQNDLHETEYLSSLIL